MRLNIQRGLAALFLCVLTASPSFAQTTAPTQYGPGGALNVYEPAIPTTAISLTAACSTPATPLQCAAGSAVVFPTLGAADFSARFAGTFVGTAAVETSDDGTNFTAQNLNQGAITGILSISQTVTAPGTWRTSVASVGYVAIVATAYTSGTITVAPYLSGKSSEVEVRSAVPLSVMPNPSASPFPIALQSGASPLPVTTPAPLGTNAADSGVNVHLLNAPTPQPFPTDASSRQIISPSTLPTPQPFPTDASGRQVISPTGLPTPLAVQPISGAPTPQPFATDGSGYQIISPTNLPTPRAVQPISIASGADTTGSLTSPGTAPTSARAVQTIAITPSTTNLTAVSTGSTGTQPAGSTVVVNMNGAQTASLIIGGTYSLSGTVEKTFDGTNWINAGWIQDNVSPPGIGTGSYGPNSSQSIQICAPSALQVRFRVTTYTSGTGLPFLTPTPFTSCLPYQSFSVLGTSGQTAIIAANTTLAAATFSAVGSVGYCKSELLVFAGTTTATGTLTVYGANDSSTGVFGTVGTTTALASGANQIDIPLSAYAPIRYVKLQSSQALTAYSANLSCSY